MKRQILFILSLLVCLSSGDWLGAAENSTQNIVDKLNQLPAGERQKALEDGARKEGQVVSYGTPRIKMIGELKKAFNEKYPYIQVLHSRTGGKESAERALMEHRAGQMRGDIMVSGVGLGKNERASIRVRYVPPDVEAIHPSMIADDKRDINLRFLPFVIAYNSSLIPAKSAPKSYKDLLRSEFKGLVGIDTVPVYLIGSMIRYGGVEKTWEYFRKLAANKPQVRRGRSIQLQFLCAGELAIAPYVTADQVFGVKKKGCPVEMNIPDPLPISQSGVSILSGAPHPHAAVLFFDFLFSKTGQTILSRLGRIPVRTDVDYEAKELTPGAVITKDTRYHLHDVDFQEKHQEVIFKIAKETLLKGRR